MDKEINKALREPRIRKLLKQRDDATRERAVNFTLKIVYKVMNEEFGYGEKRLGRLEEAILKEIKNQTN